MTEEIKVEFLNWWGVLRRRWKDGNGDAGGVKRMGVIGGEI